MRIDSIDRVTIEHPTGRENFTRLTLGEVTIWFSYRTPIAVHRSGSPVMIRENEWGPTTGRHLNYVADSFGVPRNLRAPADVFAAKVAEYLAG